MPPKTKRCLKPPSVYHFREWFSNRGKGFLSVYDLLLSICLSSYHHSDSVYIYVYIYIIAYVHDSLERPKQGEFICGSSVPRNMLKK